MRSRPPVLSVIVPVHNGAHLVAQSLGALEASTLPRQWWELIVVDDASTDETAAVASRYADAIVRLDGSPRGPAFARNRGIRVARGDIVAFVDADVCAHPDTLAEFLALFVHDESLGAAFGSYDAAPPGRRLASRFRNLLHHHIHQTSAGEAETFWAGCGAARRSLLLEHPFDEHQYRMPQIEDIELGRRLRRHGIRIMLRPEIQGTHLKDWSLTEFVRTDFWRRGVPWTRLLLSDRSRSSATLNLSVRERSSALLVGLATLAACGAVFTRSAVGLLLAAALLLPVLVLHREFYAVIASRYGRFAAVRSVPLHMLYYLTALASAGTGALLFLIDHVKRTERSADVARELVLDRRIPVPEPVERWQPAVRVSSRAS